MRKAFGMQGWVLSLALACAAMTAQASEMQVPREGYSLRAEAQGQGALVVVFESGFGQGPGVWKDTINDLGAQCRCIAYARAGSKTIEQHLQDLRAVVDTLAPGQKVVLVGHSYGGLLATEFSRQHPERLSGLVLVDPATMGQRHDARRAAGERVLADDKALLQVLPPNLAEDYKLLITQLDSEAAAIPRGLPDLPVALLTSTQVAAEPFVFEETEEGKALWKRQHADLFAGVSRGRHQYFATGHNIHRENPKGVAEAIRFVAAQTGK